MHLEWRRNSPILCSCIAAPPPASSMIAFLSNTTIR